MSELNDKIGQVIRRQRKFLDYTQENLAELSDLNVTFIGEIERGHCNPTVDTLNKIAGALGCSLTDILSAAENHNSVKDKVTALLSEYADKLFALYEDKQ